jgi:hypothetical protein
VKSESAASYSNPRQFTSIHFALHFFLQTKKLTTFAEFIAIPEPQIFSDGEKMQQYR